MTSRGYNQLFIRNSLWFGCRRILFHNKSASAKVNHKKKLPDFFSPHNGNIIFRISIKNQEYFWMKEKMQTIWQNWLFIWKKNNKPVFVFAWAAIIPFHMCQDSGSVGFWKGWRARQKVHVGLNGKMGRAFCVGSAVNS